jgi:hypothetical protein
MTTLILVSYLIFAHFAVRPFYIFYFPEYNAITINLFFNFDVTSSNAISC